MFTLLKINFHISDLVTPKYSLGEEWCSMFVPSSSQPAQNFLVDTPTPHFFLTLIPILHLVLLLVISRIITYTHNIQHSHNLYIHSTTSPITPTLPPPPYPPHTMATGLQNNIWKLVDKLNLMANMTKIEYVVMPEIKPKIITQALKSLVWKKGYG